MAETGEQHVAEIQQDLTCPACEYNLRGLRGAVVQCPECGATCDVAKLITNRWRKPWYRAPKLNVVYTPTAIAVVGLLTCNILAVLVAAALNGGAARNVGIATIITVLLLLLLWVAAMWRAYRVFDDPKGWVLAVLGHGLLIGYVGGLGMVISGLTMTFAVGGVPGAVFGLIIAVVGGALIWVCRRGEKYIAGQCIRRYLERQSAADT